MSDFKQRLDAAISRYLAGSHDPQDELDPYFATLETLEPLRDIPPRDQEKAATGRRAFLQQARQMLKPVSIAPKHRLNGWTNWFRKERSPMLTLARIVLALVVTLGGAGATTYAAQASLPSDTLYPVKLLTEDLRLSLTTNHQAEIDLLLELTARRIAEIAALAEEGLPTPTRVTNRLQEHLHQAINHAAQLDNGALMQTMQQIRTMTQSQIQLMEQVRQHAPVAAGEGLELAQQNMVQMRTIAEGALTDPTSFRMRQGTNRPETAPEQPETAPDQPEEIPGGCGKGDNLAGDCTPQATQGKPHDSDSSTDGNRGPGRQP